VGAVQEARGLRVELVLVGGLYRPRSNAVSGPLALEQITRFHAGKTFMGVDGFDLEEGLTTPTMSMASVERAMIAQTRGEVIALADNSKLGVVADVVICGLDEIDTVMVDDGVEPGVRDEIGRLGPRCLVV
jgi:DeoR/GlpR family transcriptional regulator of sugar metabolism